MAFPALAGNESRAKAFALPDGGFEVVADFSEDAVYWCGAAVYARTKLSRPGTDRIFVLQGAAPSAAMPGENSIRFSFERPARAENVSPYSNDTSVVGNSMSVAQAFLTCNERSASG